MSGTPDGEHTRNGVSFPNQARRGYGSRDRPAIETPWVEPMGRRS